MSGPAVFHEAWTGDSRAAGEAPGRGGFMTPGIACIAGQGARGLGFVQGMGGGHGDLAVVCNVFGYLIEIAMFSSNEAYV